jgi:hypothetical protein
MDEQPRPQLRPAFVAVLLVVLGVALWAAYRLTAGTEKHAYSPNAIPPDFASVTANQSYKLSYPGGVRALTDQGLDPRVLTCTWSSPAGAKQTLNVEGYRPDVESRNEVGVFEGPTTGKIQILCDGLGAMFVDDADNVAFDPAGWFLVASTIVLTIGVALTMRVLRGAPRRVEDEVAPSPHTPWAAGEDDEVQRLVRLVRDRAADDD